MSQKKFWLAVRVIWKQMAPSRGFEDANVKNTLWMERTELNQRRKILLTCRDISIYMVEKEGDQ